MFMRRYQKIFRSRWNALFWAGCVLVSAYFSIPAREAMIPPAMPPETVAASRNPVAPNEQSLDELIAAAQAAEDERQEQLRQIGQ